MWCGDITMHCCVGTGILKITQQLMKLCNINFVA